MDQELSSMYSEPMTSHALAWWNLRLLHEMTSWPPVFKVWRHINPTKKYHGFLCMVQPWLTVVNHG